MSQKKEKVKKEKPKKEKVIYYDDESTISDMSAVGGTRHKVKDKNAPKATHKEKARTFFEAQKMMLLPCAIVLAVIILLYVLMMILTHC